MFRPIVAEVLLVGSFSVLGADPNLDARVTGFVTKLTKRIHHANLDAASVEVKEVFVRGDLSKQFGPESPVARGVLEDLLGCQFPETHFA